MNISRGFPIGFALTSLAIAWGCATTSPAKSASAPRIAEIGGIQIGYSTQEELEQSWGEGFTTVGGHPNSGRRWRVRGTDWIIATDGFMYSDRGLVIDGLQMGPAQPDPEPELMETPFAKLEKKEFAWLGEISPGMTRAEVITALNRQTLTFKEEGETLDVGADGFSPITSQAGSDFHHWQARLIFTEGKLSTVQLDAH